MKRGERILKVVLDKDGLLLEVVEHNGQDPKGTGPSFGETMIWYLGWFTFGGALVNAAYVFNLV